MPRRKKCRMIGYIPNNTVFYPEENNSEEEKIILNYEEVEAIRLSDLLKMEQDNAAKSMNISRGTFQRILNSAREKLADALIHGKTINMHGGEYKVVKGGSCCKRHKRNNNSTDNLNND